MVGNLRVGAGDGGDIWAGADTESTKRKAAAMETNFIPIPRRERFYLYFKNAVCSPARFE
jgi:hypothetical protein